MVNLLLRLQRSSIPRIAACGSAAGFAYAFTSQYDSGQRRQFHWKCNQRPAAVNPIPPSSIDQHRTSNPPNDPSASDPAATATTLHQQLFHLLRQQCRGIPVSSSSIRLLSDPTTFHQTLIDLASRTQRRILLSSLYLGTGPLEQQLVQAISRRMAEQPQIKVDVLLDYLRGTRKVGKNEESSVTTLRPLIEATVTPDSNASHPTSSSHSSRFGLSLLHVPPPLPGVHISYFRSWIEHRFFRGNKTREAVGVHHMKFYVFDDHVVISGANLSDTYFSNRQDRYIVIESAELASFYESLFQTIQQMPFCYRVGPDGTVPPLPLSDRIAAQHSQRDGFAQRLLPLVQPTSSTSSHSSSTSASFSSSLRSATDSNHDTWIFPTLQMGSLNVTHDEMLTCSLLQLCSAEGRNRSQPAVASTTSSNPPTAASQSPPLTLDIATGYMNLTDRYVRHLLRTMTPIRFIAAARDANGWWGATGGGRYVPEMYAAATLSFLRRVNRANKSHLLQLYEWSRGGWSYHAKGLWMSAAADADGDSSTPLLTMIGSPNFGARSVQRDTETSIVLLTQPQSTLAHALKHERDALIKQSIRVTLNGKGSRGMDPAEPVRAADKPPLRVQWIAKLAQQYM